ncbi:AAA family ATPase [Actinoplanes sp. L3-i22]|uniref:AAA family ATPase n=1 Tax=Actinoplanes sp. L3-i22 TaxID=2836373 RepID=UPI001C7566AA|nr:AAA family ATPase [Actinoplanes sp. L3-i22]BCY09982.1 LuxR family transcriptional regulator [Actinoplanes sp. L3-i22]
MIGRSGAVSRLRALFDGRPVAGAALVVHGDAGLGKSTLVDDTVAFAAGLGVRTLAGSGAEAESPIPFAALHQLIHPLLDRADALPVRQRSALRAAFGAADGPADRMLVALAVFSLLTDLARDRPLLLVTEDVQWMDQPSVEVIGFVARRLTAAPIVLVATCRPAPSDPLGAYGLPRLVLAPMPAAEAAALLESVSPGLDAEIRHRVLDEAEGNPLAIVELARALTRQVPLDPGTLPPRLPLTGRPGSVFAGRVAALPADTRRLLLLAAADPGQSLADLARAAARTGLDLDPLDAAERDDLVTVAGARLLFRHPLLRPTIYHGATLAARLAAHRAFAEVVDDPVRAVWHLAAATVGPDEAVAAELERTARGELARGGPAAAMAGLRRAAQLSPAATARARRFAEAADAARHAGRNDRAMALIRQAREGPADPVAAALTMITEATVSLTIGHREYDIAAQVAVARAVLPVDPGLGAEVLVMAAMHCHSRAAPAAVRDLVTAAVLDLHLDPADPRRVMGLAAADPARYVRQVRPAMLAAIRELPRLPYPVHVALALATDALHLHVEAQRAWMATVDATQHRGAVAELSVALSSLASSRLHTGQLTEALTEADAGRRLSEELDLGGVAAYAAATAAIVHAWRGDTAALDEVLAVVVRPATANVVADLDRARGLAALAGGRFAAAADAFVAARAHPAAAAWGIADLVEAACRAGQADRVRPLLEQTAGYAEPFDSAQLRLLLERARALLADGPAAERHFRASIAEGVTGKWPLEVARTRLVYGEWLRRQRRSVAARDELAAAAQVFDTVGATPWADRARRALRSAGVSVPQTAGSMSALSGSELQIARLAATGLSNREIGDRLQLSHRTVGAHLYRIFPKLGITARAELRQVPGIDAPTPDD